MLGVLPLVVLAQLGVVICLGVLLDTLLVRTVLVPAIAIQLADRFWWPRHVGPDVIATPSGPGRSPRLRRRHCSPIDPPATPQD